MQKLVIYYSLSGNTRCIAEAIATAAGADVLELQLAKDDARLKGFQKYFWGGRQIFIKGKPALKVLDKNPADYDFLFIGTPVWAWRHTPALETFFSTVSVHNKRIALFSCHGGGKGTVFDKMKTRLAGNEIVGEIDFKEPLRQSAEVVTARVHAWVTDMLHID